MNIALIFDSLTDRATGHYVADVFDELGISYQHFWTKDSMRIPDTFDLYLRVDEGEYSYDIPHHLKPSAYWALDTHLKYAFKRIKQWTRDYDFVFCPQLSDVKKLEGIGAKVKWVPVACDPKLHSDLGVDREYDVGFVGTDGGVPRKFLLQEMRERYDKSFLGLIDHRQMNTIYSASKIGFQYIISYFTGECAVTMRLFEIAACGALVLTNRGEAEALSLMGFKNKENIIVYNDADELFSLTEYYLKHEDERRRIAEAGKELVLSRHTYTHRVKDMLEFIKKNTP